MRARTTLAAATAVAALALPVAAWASDTDAAPSDRGRPYPSQCASGDRFDRTELFFGLSRPGGKVTNAEFETFVDAELTKRFPDGLTVVRADGQFKDSSGTIIEEKSRMVILLYPAGDPASSADIDAVRDAYKIQFDQQSVLRTDETSCVSF